MKYYLVTFCLICLGFIGFLLYHHFTVFQAILSLTGKELMITAKSDPELDHDVIRVMAKVRNLTNQDIKEATIEVDAVDPFGKIKKGVSDIASIPADSSVNISCYVESAHHPSYYYNILLTPVIKR